MVIQKLILKNFRNHKNFELAPSPRTNLLIGDSGQGKTAVLEACHLALFGKSFRQGRSWIKKGEKEASIHLQFQNQEGQGEIFVEFKEGLKPKRFLNQKNIRNSFKNPSLFFLPESLKAIREDASHRRKLMDDLVEPQSSGKKALLDFKKILKQKNHFLKSSKAGFYSHLDRSSYLEMINKKFIELSSQLIALRFKALDEIFPFWKKRVAEILKTKDCQVEYLISKQKVTKPCQAQNILKEQIEKRHPLEAQRGICLAGPHLHDLRFFCYGHEARESLSGGQQKALLLSWKMASWDINKKNYGCSPPIFLDDVFSEIDQHFSKNLLKFLVKTKTQSLVATNQWPHPLLGSYNLASYHLGKRDINDRNIHPQKDL